MNAATLEREKQDTTNPTRMIHWMPDSTPNVALCGAKLKGEIVPDEVPLDCLVCQEMTR